MSTDLAKSDSAAMLERVVVGGDLSLLAPAERMMYYKQVCESVGLNPLTRPFDYLTLSGKMVLYAKRDATDQLRKIHGVSIQKLEKDRFDDLFVVTAYAKDAKGREDSSTGAVSIKGLAGDMLANAIMKAETKAKRRVTLSICGLGLLDETEVETVKDAKVLKVDHETGEVADYVAAVAAPVKETVEEEAARLFKTPGEEERAEKVAVLESIAKGFQALKLGAKEQVATWDKHTGTAPFLDPDGVTLDALTMLLDELRARHRAQESRKK